MAENENQPREYDAVLGGQPEIPLGAAVLGGIVGVKTRLASPIVGSIAAVPTATGTRWATGSGFADFGLRFLSFRELSFRLVSFRRFGIPAAGFFVARTLLLYPLAL